MPTFRSLQTRLATVTALLLLICTPQLWADEAVPAPPPSLERLLDIPPQDLASGIRTITDSQLPFTTMVRTGMGGYSFPESGRTVMVTARNVDLWESAFSTRLDLYLTAARRRGSQDIAGAYGILFHHTDCGPTPTDDWLVQVVQSGPSFSFVLEGKLNGVGTIIENTILLNLKNTRGDVPYWHGTTSETGFTLADPQSKCRVSLVKREPKTGR